MTTYATGNPVPSTKPQDLFDNAENLDSAMNDLSNPNWTDRLGRPRKTYAELERLADANTAIAAAGRAEEARDAAIDAADLAQASSNTVWVKLHTELEAITDRPSGTPGAVTNDPDPAKNGYYVWDGSAWTMTDLQPGSAAAVEEAKSTADSALTTAQGAQSTAAEANVLATAVAQLIGSAGGNSVLIGDKAGNIGLKLSRDELLSGAVGFVRAANGDVLIQTREGALICEVAPMPPSSPYLIAYVDRAGSIGAALMRDGTVVSKGSGPAPEPTGAYQSPVINAAYLRNARMAWARLKDGANRKLNISIIGDSNTDAATRFVSQLTRRIMRELGDGGGGWIGFGFNGDQSHGNARQGSTAGTTEEGTDNLGAPYGVSRLSATGMWECEFTDGGGPDLSVVTSSTAGAPITIAYYPDKAVEMVGGSPIDMSRLQLHYDAQSACTLEYAWNGSTTFTPLLLAASGGPSVIDIGTPPAGKAWVNLRLVSGTARLFGAYAYNNAPGATVSKLGVNGVSARVWSLADQAKYVASTANVPTDVFIPVLGSNDQSLGQSASQYLSSIQVIYGRLRSAKPVADILVVIPEENADPNRAPYPMAGYAAAARKWCLDNKIPFLDLQSFFGATVDYGPDGAFPCLTDVVHLAGQTGGALRSNAIFNTLFLSQ